MNNLNELNEQSQNQSTFHNALGRMGPLAIVDVAGTILIGWWISRRFNWPTVPTIAGTFVVGELVHVKLGVETPVTKMLKK